MSIATFLQQIRDMSFELDEKENQLLCRTGNSKRSSATTSSKLPFAELTKGLKSKKKITFALQQEEEENQWGMSDSVETKADSKSSREVGPQGDSAVGYLAPFQFRLCTNFPDNFEERIKVLRSLR